MSIKVVECIDKGESVRTGMRLGQPGWVTVRAVDGEPLYSLHSLQVDKPSQWHTRGSCRETQNFGPLLSVERLQRSPPPDDNRVRARVSIVLGRSPPLIHINVRRSRNKQFHLLFVELRGFSEGEGNGHAGRLTIEISSFGMIS